MKKELFCGISWSKGRKSAAGAKNRHIDCADKAQQLFMAAQC